MYTFSDGLPRISIITVVFNDLAGVAFTLKSIEQQDYSCLEYIVIDGASNDGTVEYLHANSKIIDILISESDCGIYDAMNKGLEKATGDWVLFMNAGDTFYCSNSLYDAVSHFFDVDMAYFGRVRVDPPDLYGWHYPPLCIDSSNYKYWLRNNLPNHQAMFFPYSFYSNHRYRLDLKISSDSDFKEKVIRLNGVVFIDSIISLFSLSGVSSSITISTQLQILVDRFRRFSGFTRYSDLIFSFFRLTLKFLLYLVLGKKSRVVLYTIKTKFDCYVIKIISILKY